MESFVGKKRAVWGIGNTKNQVKETCLQYMGVIFGGRKNLMKSLKTRERQANFYDAVHAAEKMVDDLDYLMESDEKC
ncbi:hypothetical protein [Acetivibrio ethanolgignens]|uniref:Uncharacterized protein n=1 Tax=Acetivibrio ethanolgignens TaxID=290052 RepID=A0A0V8QBN9_9FIRM|nr:hypothetical protein [Acetivibrio ethanolgignens]KSV57497.1 hypothetical protein ASU35_04790 [Acetivibrio ethanolgignens]